MELELATIEDIANELLSRQIRFAFVAVGDTNSPLPEFTSFSGKGVDHRDVSELFNMGREVFELGNDDLGEWDAE